MRPDNLNLLFLCLPAITAVLAVWWFHPTRADIVNKWRRQLLLGLFGSLFFLLQVSGSGFHKCMKGQPYTHIIVGIACGVVVMFGTRYGAKRILSGILIFVLVQLSLSHYHYLVHRAGYLGVPELCSMHVDNQDLPPTKATPLWHTPLTRLYKLPSTMQETRQFVPPATSEPAPFHGEASEAGERWR